MDASRVFCPFCGEQIATSTTKDITIYNIDCKCGAAVEGWTKKIKWRGGRLTLKGRLEFRTTRDKIIVKINKNI